MTEKEKMLKGILYDDQLLKDRDVAKDLCHQYNNHLPSDDKSKAKTLEKLIKKLGDNAIILAPFWCDYGYNIEIGKNFFANHNLVILDGANVLIGDNVFVGPNCGIFTAGHPLDHQRRNQGLEYAHPITIGDNVWLGAGVQILPGVTIGDNVVIGAGCVVNKDIPANSVAAGNPCKVIREITEKDKENQWEYE